MPALINADGGSKKRKRSMMNGENHDVRSGGALHAHHKKSMAKHSALSDITILENAIAESQQNYNNIATLLSLSKKELRLGQSDVPATMSLCRVFCRLLIEGRLSKSKTESPNEALVSEWLKERYSEYQRLLLATMRSSGSAMQRIALALGMQIVREEVINAKASADSIWRTAFFSKILFTLLKCSTNFICKLLVDQFAQNHDDVRHYTFMLVAQSLAGDPDADDWECIRGNSLSLLTAINSIEHKASKLDTLFCEITGKADSGAIPRSAHRKQAQQAWLALLHSGLDKDQRKSVLRDLTHHVVPWFQNVELLMDFLTDSYDTGGATSLLSLSGLFYLIQEKNLDYPDFFTKLYSLLDYNLLHSKHRSRFFRLLNTFMSSTHLPAAMVASFIKRLSRLALDAPPAAIVAIVPWIYNMLKSHPTCTFMIHREPRTPEDRQRLDNEGMDDPFDMDEQDPMETNAIESCLWEIERLQSHFHPNVASLARIISQQFTKTSYNLDDFLDHSYSTLIEAELGKELKKTPVVEFEIPKRVFILPNGDSALESQLQGILQPK